MAKMDDAVVSSTLTIPPISAADRKATILKNIASSLRQLDEDDPDADGVEMASRCTDCGRDLSVHDRKRKGLCELCDGKARQMASTPVVTSPHHPPNPDNVHAPKGSAPAPAGTLTFDDGLAMGGPGSGNFGHAGIPGQRGGSSSGGGGIAKPDIQIDQQPGGAAPAPAPAPADGGGFAPGDDDELARLKKEVANEGDEKDMGIMEKAARARIKDLEAKKAQSAPPPWQKYILAQLPRREGIVAIFETLDRRLAAIRARYQRKPKALPVTLDEWYRLGEALTVLTAKRDGQAVLSPPSHYEGLPVVLVASIKTQADGRILVRR